MSGGGGSKASGPASGVIPAAARKLVQSLKEIVNSPDAEIYAMLKECDMDPDEAVNRLLSQDTFHEVRSKRDKKKEIKDNPEPRSRTVNSSSSRGARGGTDRGVRSSILSGSGVTRVKTSNKKEIETSTLPTSSILGSGLAASNSTHKTTAPSSAADKNVMLSTGLADGRPMPLHPSYGFHHKWSGMPGHVSMADIVKMGKPQGRPSNTSIVESDRSFSAQNASMSNMPPMQSSSTILPLELNQSLAASNGPVTQVIDISNDADIAATHHISADDWSLVDELSGGRGSTLPETSGGSLVHADPSESSTLIGDKVNLHAEPPLDETESLEGDVESRGLSGHTIRSLSVSERQIQVENSEDSSYLDDGSSKSMNAYSSQRHLFEHSEVEDVNLEISSAAADLHQLNLHKEELVGRSSEDNPAVIIPNHLQVTNADCAHLSFGSFESGTFSGSFPSKPLKSSSDIAPIAENASSVDQSDSRNQEYHNNVPLRPSTDENVTSRTGTSPDNLHMPSASEPEIVRGDSLDATLGLHYNFPSVSGYAFQSTSQPNAGVYTYQQANAQLQNLSPFSSLLQANTSPSSLLAPNVPPLRDFDLSFSPLLTTQSMATKYSTAVSSISGPTISMQESLKPGVFSNTQSPQSLPSTSTPPGAPLPQHLPVHHYSQPTLPLGPFGNMIGYQFLPQSYTYLPSAAFQQPYSSNGPFHQSAATVPSAGMKYTLPQYKSNIPVVSLPQPASMVSGFGGYGSSSNIPGSFSLNSSTASASTTLGFDEALSSHYRDANHYMSLHQSENPGLWLHGAGSRTMSALPASNFYGYQREGQQSGTRQAQQQPSQFAALGYPNLYHSQAGLTQEHQQNSNEVNLNGSQATASQPSHQIWQHSY
ncbi:uncharacterized protein [Typha angustifolia]|uniref:uncharacterized protein n=1 Tax=Typha angustifolia TaxID=59011 RepID=UPI003C3049E0